MPVPVPLSGRQQVASRLLQLKGRAPGHRGEEGAKSLASALRELTQLKTLVLSLNENMIGPGPRRSHSDAGATALLESLRELRQLTNLEVELQRNELSPGLGRDEAASSALPQKNPTGPGGKVQQKLRAAFDSLPVALASARWRWVAFLRSASILLPAAEKAEAMSAADVAVLEGGEPSMARVASPTSVAGAACAGDKAFSAICIEKLSQEGLNRRSSGRARRCDNHTAHDEDRRRRRGGCKRRRRLESGMQAPQPWLRACEASGRIGGTLRPNGQPCLEEKEKLRAAFDALPVGAKELLLLVIRGEERGEAHGNRLRCAAGGWARWPLIRGPRPSWWPFPECWGLADKAEVAARRAGVRTSGRVWSVDLTFFERRLGRSKRGHCCSIYAIEGFVVSLGSVVVSDLEDCADIMLYYAYFM
ncbi:nhaD [Symbiodinium sp. CCMP2592]|nr:nhaD [Symbiodinium sp. CCMP2592]